MGLRGGGGGISGLGGGHVRGARRVLGGKAVHCVTSFVHAFSCVILDIGASVWKFVTIFIWS